MDQVGYFQGRCALKIDSDVLESTPIVERECCTRRKVWLTCLGVDQYIGHQKHCWASLSEEAVWNVLHPVDLSAEGAGQL